MAGINIDFIAKYTSQKTERNKELVDKLNSGMKEACLIVERQAKINVSKVTGHPQVQTGRLRASITNKVSKEGDKVVGKVGSGVEYAPYLEHGTGDGKRMSPYPWLYPAAEEKKGEVTKALAKGGGIL